MAPSGSRAGADLTLRVTAFNDTNDLLTWHIPKRYASTTDTCRPQIKLANVFVRTTPPLLILENPLAAHGDYFSNPDVWLSIVCGADDGALLDCKR